MNNELIYNVKLVEKYKRAIPALKDLIERNGYYYVAGTLVLSGVSDPLAGTGYINLDIYPIDDYESDVIREALYLASKIYVAHKEERCAFYAQALSNIEQYEQIHGRESEPSGTDAIS